MLMQGGRAVMPFGVMGGQYQPFGHTHLLTNILDFEFDVQRALDHPRLFYQDDTALVKTSADGPLPTVERMATETARGSALGRWIAQSGMSISLSGLVVVSVLAAFGAALGAGALVAHPLVTAAASVVAFLCAFDLLFQRKKTFGAPKFATGRNMSDRILAKSPGERRSCPQYRAPEPP